MKFSGRTDWSTASNPLSQMIEQKKKEGVPLIDMAQSNPTLCNFRFYTKDKLKPLMSEKNLLYEPDAHGLQSAREAVCEYYAEKGTRVLPEQVFLTAGTSEAYSFVFRLLCEARELVVAPRPSYPLFDYLASLADVDIIHYFLNYENGWKMSADSLEIPFIEKPKALIVVNPNNPTGNFLKPEELRSINRQCRRTGTAVISDEVFLDFAFDARKIKPVSLAGNQEVLTFTLSGISKILGFPQMKLSWIVISGPPEEKQAAIERLEVIADTYLSVNTPAQHALGDWLEDRDSVRKEMLERMKANFQLLRETFAGHKKIEVLSCEGGWYGTLKLAEGKSDEKVALSFLEKQNIIVHPGYFFDFREGEFLVVSFLAEPKIFAEGVKRLAKGLN